MVALANALAERGFKEGNEDERGASGPQFVLGGMRSGQGLAAGIGWRRPTSGRSGLDSGRRHAPPNMAEICSTGVSTFTR